MDNWTDHARAIEQGYKSDCLRMDYAIRPVMGIAFNSVAYRIVGQSMGVCVFASWENRERIQSVMVCVGPHEIASDGHSINDILSRPSTHDKLHKARTLARSSVWCCISQCRNNWKVLAENSMIGSDSTNCRVLIRIKWTYYWAIRLSGNYSPAQPGDEMVHLVMQCDSQMNMPLIWPH